MIDLYSISCALLKYSLTPRLWVKCICCLWYTKSKHSSYSFLSLLNTSDFPCFRQFLPCLHRNLGEDNSLSHKEQAYYVTVEFRSQEFLCFLLYFIYNGLLEDILVTSECVHLPFAFQGLHSVTIRHIPEGLTWKSQYYLIKTTNCLACKFFFLLFLGFLGFAHSSCLEETNYLWYCSWQDYKYMIKQGTDLNWKTLCSDLNTQTKSRKFTTSINQTKVTDKSWQNRIRLKWVHLNIVCRNLFLVRCLVWLMEMLWGKKNLSQ